MNETVSQVVEASEGTDAGLALVALAAMAYFLWLGWLMGRISMKPKSLQRSVLRKALDGHLSALEASVGKDAEEYRVAAQLRHGRVLREKYDD